MIIDRVFDDFGRIDKEVDVMNLWSFYECSSPPNETNLSPGYQSPWSPHSSTGSGSSAGSPPHGNLTATHAKVPGGGPPYQGVRVKNTVKDMIMQKRFGEIQQPAQNCNSVPTSACPAPTSLVLGTKRPADLPMSPPAPKRAATSLNNALSDGDLLDSFLLNSISDLLADASERAPLSINSVKVQGRPIQLGPLPQDQDTQALFHANVSPGNPPAPCLEMPYASAYPALAPQPGPNGPAATPLSFFHWQIQQEEQRLAGLTPPQLTTRDDDGDTFLHIAVAQGRRALAYVLAKKMADISMLDIKEHNNQSAFQVSVAANQHLIAQDLLAFGAQVNTLDSWGRSPLHVCAEKGHSLALQAIHKSMQNGGGHVNVEMVNYDGLTPLHVAVLAHNAVVQELSLGVAPHSPQTAELVQKRKLLGDCINTLLLMGACYASKDRKSGRTALHMAAEEANVELLRAFLDQPNSLSVVNKKTFNGSTALHLASGLQGRQAQADAVKLLMRRGADPSAKNLENEQPAQLVPEGTMGEQVRRILKGRLAQARSATA